MMKYCLAFTFCLCSLFSFGQKHDNIWPLANYYGLNSTWYYYLNFSNGLPDTISYERKMHYFLSNAAISDSAGNIQFYSNGIWIANKQNDTMLYSQIFNPGYLYFSYYSSGMGISQAILGLPFETAANKYFLIHESGEYFTNKDSVADVQPFNLRYTVIDMVEDSGKGMVDTNFKSVMLINDTLLLGRITACKHANGRDWWVIAHQYYSYVYYKLLFTPNGVFGPFTQSIGTFCYPKYAGNADYDIVGMACFSPDGSKYVMYGPDNNIELFDFDRCTGNFSNYRTALVPDTLSTGQGCSFSANSQYLYVNTFYKAYQYDTYSTNLSNSEIEIADWDGYLNPIETWFFLNQIGPDGRIYIGTWNFCKTLHVIENPDSAGIACNFNQHSLTLPQNYGGNVSLPNFPNYRLGPLIGSPCDTIISISNNKPPNINLKVSPNPNDGNFIVNYELPQNKSGMMEIYDVMGNSVFRQPLPHWSTMQRINLKTLTAGIYVVKVYADGSFAGAVRVVKEW